MNTHWPVGQGRVRGKYLTMTPRTSAATFCSCYIVIVNSLISELVLFVPADQLALCLHRVRCDCTTLNVFSDVPWLYMVSVAFPQIKRHWSNTIRDPVKSHGTARVPRVGIWWRVLFTFRMLQFQISTPGPVYKQKVDKPVLSLRYVKFIKSM